MLRRKQPGLPYFGLSLSGLFITQRSRKFLKLCGGVSFPQKEVLNYGMKLHSNLQKALCIRDAGESFMGCGSPAGLLHRKDTPNGKNRVVFGQLAGWVWKGNRGGVRMASTVI